MQYVSSPSSEFEVGREVEWREGGGAGGAGVTYAEEKLLTLLAIARLVETRDFNGAESSSPAMLLSIGV